MSKFVPPTFAGFGKSALFQVYDKDSLDTTVALKHKSKGAEGLRFEPSIVYAPKATPRGVVKVGFTNRARYLTGVTVDATLHTDASKSSTVAVSAKNVLPSALPGLNVTVTDSTSEKDLAKPAYGVFATVAADYTRNNATVTAGVTTDAGKQVAVVASASVGYDGFSVGGDVKLVKSESDASLAPKSYNAGAVYTFKPTPTGAVYSVSAVTDAKFDKIKATLLSKKFYGYGHIDAGVQAKVDVKQPKAGAAQREVTVGVDYRSTPETTYKGALVLNTGAGVFGVEHRPRGAGFSLGATAVFGKPQSFYAPFPVNKFGVALTLGEI